MDKAAEEVKNAIYNGIDLIRDGAGIQATLVTFIIQILATLVLFLFVRFFLWNTIMNILNKRKEAEAHALEEKDEMIAETAKLKKEAETIISNSQIEAEQIKQQKLQEALDEGNEIITKANEVANKKMEDAEANIEQQYQDMQNQIKEEIINTAYLLSQKITEKEIDEKKNKEIIDNFFKSEEAK